VTTLYELTKRIHLKLHDPKKGTATSGDTDTIIDTTMINAESDDYYNGGTIFVENGNNAATSDEITDWDQSAYAFSLRTTASGAYAAGDRYLAFTDDYTRDEVIQALNEAINELPPIVKQDVSTPSVADQMYYDFPTNGWEVVGVELATSTSSPYNYVPIYTYKLINDGTNDQIAFEEGTQPQHAGYIIRISYKDYPDEINVDTDTLHDWYDADWVAWEAAVRALAWKLAALGGQDQFIIAKHAEAEQKATAKRLKHSKKIPSILQAPTLGGWAGV